LFAAHSERIEKQLQSEVGERRKQIFARYCAQVRQLLGNLKGGPANADYYLKSEEVAKTRETKSVLCIVPHGAKKLSCDIQIDVAVEGDVMKKDEL
jgi:hypothetical protein